MPQTSYGLEWIPFHYTELTLKPNALPVCTRLSALTSLTSLNSLRIQYITTKKNGETEAPRSSSLPSDVLSLLSDSNQRPRDYKSRALAS